MTLVIRAATHGLFDTTSPTCRMTGQSQYNGDSRRVTSETTNLLQKHARQPGQQQGSPDEPHPHRAP